MIHMLARSGSLLVRRNSNRAVVAGGGGGAVDGAGRTADGGGGGVEGSSIGQVFEFFENNKQAYMMEDYSVTQTTLEQIFIQFAAKGAQEEERETARFASGGGGVGEAVVDTANVGVVDVGHAAVV
jgi:hypothetical protein